MLLKRSCGNKSVKIVSDWRDYCKCFCFLYSKNKNNRNFFVDKKWSLEYIECRFNE